MRKPIVRDGYIYLLCISFVIFAGCGSDNDAHMDDFNSMRPFLDALDNRLGLHLDTVQAALGVDGSLTSYATLPTTGLADIVDGPAGEDWDAVWMEHGDYSDDMHDYMDALGEMVAMIGNCRMMVGGMMHNPHDTPDFCSSQPHMEDTEGELERHLLEMQSCMDLLDSTCLWEEMNLHMEQMASHIEEMASHMRGVYGFPHDGMMGS